MNAVLLVCETCGLDEREPDATRKGELFARELEQWLTEQTDAATEFPQLKRYRCLMSCKRHCVVQLRAPGKLGYVIGDFVPNAAAAETLLDYSPEMFMVTGELRTPIPVPQIIPGDLIGSVFVDSAVGRLFKDPKPMSATNVTNNTQHRTGVGIGLTWGRPDDFLIKGFAAWRLTEESRTGTSTGFPQIYFSVSKLF